MSNTIDVSLYFVGSDIDDAQENFPFDCWESAWGYLQDAYEGCGHIYVGKAILDFSTLEEIQ